MRHGKEAETEQRMDAALRVDKNPFALRSLELETVEAVARCYRAPYNTYGKVKAYIREWGRLPPEEYRLPRYKWQQQPRRGTRCRSLRGLESASALPDAAAAGGGGDAGQHHPLLGVPAGGAETPLKKRERPVGAETQPDAQKQKGRNSRWPTRKTRQTARPTYSITRRRAKHKRRRRHGLF